jgi:hypothetical protein
MRRPLVFLAALLLLVPALAGAAAACRMANPCAPMASMNHACCKQPKATLHAGCCDPDAPAPARTATGSARVEPPALLVSAQPPIAPALPAIAVADESIACLVAARAALHTVLRT